MPTKTLNSFKLSETFPELKLPTSQDSPSDNLPLEVKSEDFVSGPNLLSLL